MVSFKEALLHNDLGKMPTPGTLAHLEYLSRLEIDDDSRLSETRTFLEETMAATSLARVIRRHRTYWPMKHAHIASLNTRLGGITKGQSASFRGSIGVSRTLPEHNNLTIYSEHKNHSYDIVIPVTPAHIYDPVRPAMASYLISNTEEGKQTWISWSYNGTADKEYPNEHDPQVLICAVQEAADDLIRILGHTPGDLRKPDEITAAKGEHVFWHPDYITDDPNELMPKASRIQGVIQRLRSMDLPWRPDYLNDDPDEFLKAS